MEQDTRVIQKTGSSSYTVSLLTGWVEDTVGAGSEVGLHRLGNSVVIFPVSENKQTEHDREQPPSVLKPVGLRSKDIDNTIRELYIRGADRIEVDVEGAEHHRDRVRDVVSNLTGMVIVSETDEQIVIQKILDGSDIRVRDSLKRLSELSVTALKESVRKTMGERSSELNPAVKQFGKLKTQFERSLTEGISNPGTLVGTDLRLPDVFYAEMCVRELSYVVENAEYVASNPPEEDRIPDKHVILNLMHKATLSIRAGTEAYLDTDSSGCVQPEFRITLSKAVNTDLGGDETTGTGREELPDSKVGWFLRSAIRRGNRLADIADRRQIVDGQDR